MPRHSVALVLVLAATGQVEACPDRDALTGGVTLVQNQPFFMRSDFRTLDGRLVEVRHRRVGQEDVVERAEYVHAFAPVSELSGNRAVVTRFAGDPSGFDRLDVLLSHRLTGVTEIDGQEQPVVIEAELQGESEVGLAGCSYPVWMVRVDLSYGEQSGTYAFWFAPSLGLNLAAFNLDESLRGTPVFAYTWIGTDEDLRR